MLLRWGETARLRGFWGYEVVPLHGADMRPRTSHAELWSAVCITALTLDSEFSLNADSLKKAPSSDIFRGLKGAYTGRLATQSGDAHRSPKVSNETPISMEQTCVHGLLAECRFFEKGSEFIHLS